jgi:hypothetical protein
MNRLVLVLVLLVWGPIGARAEELALAQFGGLDDARASWRTHATKDGVTLERRAVPGSRFYEHRAAVELPVAPDVVADDLWRTLRSSDKEAIRKRQILSESSTELLVYDQVHTPIVSDRDYVLRVQRIHDPARRRTEFRCMTVEGVGPPVAPGHVRIPMIRAGWLVEPTASGGTRLTYFAYSEPGGMVAAFVVRGAQADRAHQDILRVSQRLRKLAP